MDVIELLDDFERVHIQQADMAFRRTGDDVPRASLHDFHVLVRRYLHSQSASTHTHTRPSRTHTHTPPFPQSLSPD